MTLALLSLSYLRGSEPDERTAQKERDSLSYLRGSEPRAYAKFLDAGSLSYLRGSEQPELNAVFFMLLFKLPTRQ